jgi:TPR repeat protein
MMYKFARLISAGAVLGFGAIPVADAAPILKAGAAVSRGDHVAEERRIIALAQRGDAHAQAILGFMYENGYGVPQSYDVAAAWYLQSAEQGDPGGQYQLGLMYDKGLGVPQDFILAHKWLNLAAAHAPSRYREYYLRLRDAVASKMSWEQLNVARRLAVEFMPRSR